MANEEYKKKLREEQRKKNILNYSKYNTKLKNMGDEWKTQMIDVPIRPDLVQNGGDIIVSPELNVIWRRIKRFNNTDEAIKAVEEFYNDPNNVTIIKRKFEERAGKRIERAESLWFGTTMNGIDIRPGLYIPNENDISASDEMHCLQLGDDCVHALMAGRTGAGKSVALHAIITNLMNQYAPWELSLNLADFKIVELSKYGNRSYEDENGNLKSAKAPHVRKIAATDSMEYVLSVMYDMYERMDIRQKVFAALGIEKLSKYRERFGVALPRELLIVDEFQQMYELASSKQEEKINQLIKMITKLGRATGFHLFFTSQSMSGTIKADTLANFKLRLCLPADEAISLAVLGNKASSVDFVGSKSKGYLYANSQGGNKEANEEYRVPLADDEALDGVLKENAILAEESGLTKVVDFYREDDVRPFWERGNAGKENSFEKDVKIFYENTSKLPNNDEVSDYLLLGDSCVYAKNESKQNTLEYFDLKMKDRKNILLLGDSIAQRAYLIELLAMQLSMRTNVRQTIVHGDRLTQQIIEKDDVGFNLVLEAEKLARNIEINFICRRKATELEKISGSEMTDGELLDRLDKDFKEAMPKESDDTCRKFSDLTLDTYKNATDNGTLPFYIKRLPLRFYYINGFQYLEDVMKSINEKNDKGYAKGLLTKCPSMGMYIVLVGATVSDLTESRILSDFQYRFLLTNDEKNFVKSEMDRPKEYKDNIVRFKAMKEVVNSQKPSLYILPQDEKIIKMFSMEQNDEDDIDEILFNGIN